MSDPDHPDISEQMQVRLDKLKRLGDRGENAYKNGMTPQHQSAALLQEYGQRSKEDLDSAAIPASVAGRIMAIRDFGKACFVRLKDTAGTLQLYVQKEKLGDENYAQFRELDLGDIIYCEGTLFKTKTGELSVLTRTLSLLTKSLRPLPEKYHGLTDVEIRYRQRYLDLIMSPETQDVFIKRSRIISEIRAYFINKGFMEVETPMMHPIAGGAAARPFVTYHNTLDMQLYLRIAPELYLKRLVVGGFDRVFEINRNFRNEGISIQHNPEFTMLEFYQAYATYVELMDVTEELFREVASKVLGKTKIDYQGVEIELGQPWTRLRFEDSILKYSEYKNQDQFRDASKITAYLDSKKFHYNPKDSVGKLLTVIFEEEVEKKLIQPTFITHYPLDVSPLSRKNEEDPFLVDRFEIFIYGREMGNAFSELNDPIDQNERFKQQAQAKAGGDLEACDIDQDFVTALEYGMPPTAGEGIGIDRMVMLLTNSASIRDVIFFPQLRSSK